MSAPKHQNNTSPVLNAVRMDHCKYSSSDDSSFCESDEASDEEQMHLMSMCNIDFERLHLPAKRHGHLLPPIQPVKWDEVIQMQGGGPNRNSVANPELMGGAYWKQWREKNKSQTHQLEKEASTYRHDDNDDNTDASTRDLSFVINKDEENLPETTRRKKQPGAKKMRRRQQPNHDWVTKGWHSTRGDSSERQNTAHVCSHRKNKRREQHQRRHSAPYRQEFSDRNDETKKKLKDWLSSSSAEHDDTGSSSSDCDVTRPPESQKLAQRRKQRNNTSALTEHNSDDMMSDELVEYDSSPVSAKKHYLSQSKTGNMSMSMTLELTSTDVIENTAQRGSKAKRLSKLKKQKTSPRYSTVTKPVRDVAGFERLPSLANSRLTQTKLDGCISKRNRGTQQH